MLLVNRDTYRALYHLVIITGMRFSELRGLSWSNVDWMRGTITVNKQIQDIPRLGTVAGAPKTHSGYRTILLGETALNELREHHKRVEIERQKAVDNWKDNDLIFPSNIGTPFSKMILQIRKSCKPAENTFS